MAAPSRFASILTGHPWLVLACVAGVTALALIQLVDWRSGELRLRIDASMAPLMLQTDGANEPLRERFEDEDLVLVMLDLGDAYAPTALRQLDQVSRALYALPMVAAVRSLTTVPLPRAAQRDEVRVQRLRPEEYADPDLAGELRGLVAANPMLAGQLLSRDGRYAAVAVTLQPQSAAAPPASVAGALRAGAATAAPGVPVALAGAAVLREEIHRAALEQLRWLLPIVALVLTAVLALSFRTVSSVLLPLSTMAITLVWTLGAVAAFDRPLNLITCLVPPLLATMALAYSAHLLSEFETLRGRLVAGRAACIQALLAETAGPVLLTGVTTAIGLLALLLTQLPAIREFALFAAFGVVCAVILALSYVPAALLVAARPGGARVLPGQHWLDAAGRRIGAVDIRHRRRILAIAAVVALAAGAAATELRFGDALTGAFREDAQVRRDFAAINNALGGVAPVAIVIDARQAESFAAPPALATVSELQNWLRDQPEVGSVISVVDHVRNLNQLFTGNEGVPDRQSLIRQLLFIGDNEAARGLLNGDLSATRLQVRLRVNDTTAVSAWLTRLEARLQSLPQHWHVEITGETVALARSVAAVTAEQLQSIALALALIYLCLSLQFASPTIGFLAALPTFLQTAIYFGALAAGGIALNATTCLVECLVLGLAVDDTIHYLARFNRAAKRSGSETAAAVRALSAVLRPVTLTKGVLALGMLLLATGELRNQALFGWLGAFTLFAAWLVDLFVTPALMSGVRVVTLWDTLRLNLGRDPHTTIPLFAGMSARQARIFALMARIETYEPGQRIIRQGDAGGDIFVVIDGSLQVWTQGDGHDRPVALLERGAVLGETGYFGQKRTAHVDALTPVRVLRFDDDDQERICKRYPAIASRVFLNLNRLQAARHPHTGVAERRSAPERAELHRDRILPAS